MLLRLLRPVAIVFYLVVAALLLAIWFPRFVAVNAFLKPTMTWTYIAACGLPMAALAVSALARQMADWRMSMSMLGVVVLALATGRLAVFVFQSPEQAPTVCAVHLFICFVGTLWNLWRYRKTVEALDKEEQARRQQTVERRQADMAARVGTPVAPADLASEPPTYAAGSLPLDTPVIPVVPSEGARPYAVAPAQMHGATASVPLTVAPPPLTRTY